MKCEQKCDEEAIWQMVRGPYLFLCTSHTTDMGDCVFINANKVSEDSDE